VATSQTEVHHSTLTQTAVHYIVTFGWPLIDVLMFVMRLQLTTNSMEQSVLLTNNRWPIQEVSGLSWNPEFHYRVQKSPPPLLSYSKVKNEKSVNSENIVTRFARQRDNNKRGFFRFNKEVYLNNCGDYTQQILHTISRLIAHKRVSSNITVKTQL
jgi:hypothetical protein